MLFAANARQQNKRVTRGLVAPLIAALLSVFSVPVPVFATDTTVGVDVRDGQPTSLTITTDIAGKTVALPTVTVEGTVHNVTQIVVYVDSTYNTSLPLASGAGDYKVAFGVTPGTHEVRVVGVDAYSNTEVSQTIRFAYEPATSGSGSSGENGSTATTTSTGSSTSSAVNGGEVSPVDSYINDTIDAAAATKEDVAKKVNQASASGPLASLSDAAYSAFKSIDLVSSADSSGIDKMAGRFTLVSVGLAASVFPWSAYALVEKLRFLPKLAIPNGMALASMRFVGMLLILIPFVFIR